MNSAPTPLERFINGILPENPTFRQLLGLCPTLAVSGSMASAITMSGCVLFVLVCSNIITSLLRNLVRPHLRILVFTVIIATFVTIVDRLLAAFYYPMSQTLGPYVPLIIVNCIVLCRCEVCASQQGVGPALGDALGQTVGFALGLSSIATFREILGQGTWFGLPVMGHDFPLWAIMVLPPGAFLTLGLLIGLVNWIGAAKQAKSATS
jgi:electron transport complex protein RnfE